MQRALIIYRHLYVVTKYIPQFPVATKVISFDTDDFVDEEAILDWAKDETLTEKKRIESEFIEFKDNATWTFSICEIETLIP